MAQITKTNGSPTVYSLRRAFGMPAKRASGFNACIGAHLKGNDYQDQPKGRGGRNNVLAHNAFKSAVQSCKGGGGNNNNNG